MFLPNHVQLSQIQLQATSNSQTQRWANKYTNKQGNNRHSILSATICCTDAIWEEVFHKLVNLSFLLPKPCSPSLYSFACGGRGETACPWGPVLSNDSVESAQAGGLSQRPLLPRSKASPVHKVTSFCISDIERPSLAILAHCSDAYLLTPVILYRIVLDAFLHSNEYSLRLHCI